MPKGRTEEQFIEELKASPEKLEKELVRFKGYEYRLSHRHSPKLLQFLSEEEGKRKGST
jgi:hypothetical protein